MLKGLITRLGILFFVLSVVLFFVLVIGFSGAAGAQSVELPPNVYTVQTFKTYNIDNIAAFDNEVNQWLREHPNIEVIDMSEAAARDAVLGDVRVKSVLYRNR